MKTRVFDIIRSSIADGPGIRTTIFIRAVICDAFGVIIRSHGWKHDGM